MRVRVLRRLNAGRFVQFSSQFNVSRHYTFLYTHFYLKKCAIAIIVTGTVVDLQGSKAGLDGSGPLPRISSGSITPEGWPTLPEQSEEELSMSRATVDPVTGVSFLVGVLVRAVQ